MEHIEARPRDAQRTREAILRAATQLFAESGYAATGLQQIADAAGVARATPSYFFRSKAGLWKAVLEEQNQLAAQIAPTAFQLAGQQPDRATLIAALVDVTLDFHAAHPEFLRLVQWSELQGNTLINEVQAHHVAVATAVHAVDAVLRDGALEQEDVRQMVLSVLGVCYAHLIFGQTLAAALNLNVDDPEFQTERRSHLKRLLLSASR
ncbi:TetR/AcrR family transcriptional regulator [Deinococcus deserti]|uniref:Putative HTH-type transcriptional regulator rutR, transcriptional regulator, TetR family n=1 Tax=Deinococcus deserti (strain DSM 17065 / CIP 109153 / LMG 22923 / VCD115) TaxID=546414 RepID=C1D236_DEIDV|nr:TetR/AcrR family transcriptional regulator [Deinococcus deserti]ACO47475.1 putative HTH-type transcriptional regulator rutR, transcriptional regulator, TetR family [Deinococcus deserti VCD115]